MDDNYWINTPPHETQELWCGGELLGPASFLYSDSKELPGTNETDGVIHRQMPHRIDIVMAGNSKVAGVESKTPTDLLNSFLSRRLKRQLRTMLDVVDLPVLLVRGQWPAFLHTKGKRGVDIIWSSYDPPSRDKDSDTRLFRSLFPLFAELTRWQMLGGVVLYGPSVDEPQATLAFLKSQRSILGGTRNVLVAVAGTDKGKEKKEGPGWFLKSVRGIGGATVEKLTVSGQRTTGEVLNGSDEELKMWGATSKQIKAIKEAMER